jgi:hypothetical protein
VLVRQLRVGQETCYARFHDIGTNDFLTGLTLTARLSRVLSNFSAYR